MWGYPCRAAYSWPPCGPDWMHASAFPSLEAFAPTVNRDGYAVASPWRNKAAVANTGGTTKHHMPPKA